MAVHIEFQQTKLKNGLQAITVEDHHAPVVSLVLTYKTGSSNERPGRTGFAHFFEHLMFQGSANVPPGEFYKLVFNNGGSMNGTTSADRTIYFETMPSNQLDVALFLESDRMRGLTITPEKLLKERNVVQEERRSGIDNQPYGKSREALNHLLYDNYAYKHQGIGSMEDLNAATVDDVQQFFKIYYAPNNAVLTLVGDFKTVEALGKIRKYFEDISAQPAPAALDLSEPPQKEERPETVNDRLAQLAEVSIAFKAVPGNTPDYYALEVASAALDNGESSRLYQRLIKQNESAASVTGRMDERRGPGALYITARLRPGKATGDAETAIYDEIARLQKEEVTDGELQKAKNSISLAFLSSLQRSLLRAILAGQYAMFYNDPDLINTRLSKISAVTKADVRRVANAYLMPANRTVVITVPRSTGFRACVVRQRRSPKCHTAKNGCATQRNAG
ncbi:MAG: M16 family metallopeptidase [Bryobacteraceae bacterium]